MASPARPANRPGLQALAYRVGTHASFVKRMLQRLATETVPFATDPTQLQPPALARLTTRSTNDPAIALIDAWATAADVLTFYQERIANEGYLRTATERQSVLQLARAIGYELNPGVAANALLAFIVEDAAGAPGQAILEKGLKVSSIPGQNETPQTFETVEKITTRAELNVLRPRATEPQTLSVGATQLYLCGAATLLEPGDGLLLVGPERLESPTSTAWDFRVVRTVEAVPPSALVASERSTRVTWSQPLGPSGVVASNTFEAFVLRQRAALFGYNAPDFRVMPDSIKAAFGAGTSATEWPGFEVTATPQPHVDLDASYPRILPDSWIVLTGPGSSQLYHVDDVAPASRTDFTLSSKVTRLRLDTNANLTSFGLRETVVLSQSEPLPVAQQTASDPVRGSVIFLDRRVDGLVAGQRLVLTGHPSVDGSPVSEAAVIDAVTDDDTGTILRLSAALDFSYDPATLTMCANVARATHGESVRNEVLGSGNGGTPNQRFTLRKPPLTHVSASTPGGAQSTLEVRVDGAQWREVPSLFGLSASDQSFTVRIEESGQSNLIFGDGKMGARLPSGAENVTATYRSGVGLDGNVRAGSLALLQVRPLGIRGVTNPLPASGAAAPEGLDDARVNAPLTVLTLDRIVSLRDFEDFARAFAGVGKALAARVWNGQAHFAHITVAGVLGGPVDPVATLPNLLVSINSVRDAVDEIVIQSYTPWLFGVAAEVLVDSRFASGDVLTSVRGALERAFSFSQRSFGQAVSAAEVISAIQAVSGVQAVSLSKLFFVRAASLSADQPLPDVPPGNPPPFLPAATARWTGSEARPAELILIDSHSIALGEMPVPV